MDKKVTFFALTVIFLLLVTACSGQSTASARTLTFTEIENEVLARASASREFTPANIGQQLGVGGEIQSGETGTARLEIQPDNTVIYVGPNSIFTLVDFSSDPSTAASHLKLALGQLWVVLGGGTLDVETPSGVASVRGSYMQIITNPDGTQVVTCLEGNCTFTNETGTTELTNGEACDLQPDGTCKKRSMTEEEIQAWENNVPESIEIIPTKTPVPTPTFTPTQQSTSDQVGDVGPQIGDFPAGINPLTGLPVEDPSLLELPAVMISIPHFPPSARPQAGLSYAPWIFEIYIGEGGTRFLATFYGEEPAVRPRLTGSCEVRTEPFVAGELFLGNRVWSDEDQDGVQDLPEPGIGGICITLYDIVGNALQQTSSDSNGYYGFNADPGTYIIGFEETDTLDFTLPDAGYDDSDSDVDPATGQTAPIDFTATDLLWDAGYISTAILVEPASTPGEGTPTAVTGEGVAELPAAEIGPIRSMRLPYGQIGKFFQGACIVSASGDPSVLAQVPGCHYEYGDDQSVNHALLDITMLRTLAEQNKKDYPVNYSGNIFSVTPPEEGAPASQLHVFWNWQNQSEFRYDPLSGSYLRYANTPGSEDMFVPQTDRLTGNQLLYDNLIIMYVEHIKYAETKIDIDLSIGQMGRADLFRDGQVYHIYWSTIGQEYEQESQRLRPVRFTDGNGNPFPLSPGHTWVHMFTTASYLFQPDANAPDQWKATFMAP